MADTDPTQLASEAKTKETAGQTDAQNSRDVSATKDQRKTRRERAEKAYEEAANKRHEAAQAYCNQGKFALAALEESKAADDWAKRAELNKEGEADGEKGEGEEYEKSLQQQISAILRAALDYLLDGKGGLAAGETDEAKALKDSYDKNHPNSKLQLNTDGQLKK